MICYFTCFLFPFFVCSLLLAISSFFLSRFYWLCFSVSPPLLLARRWGHWRVCEQASQKKKERKKRKVFLYIPRPVVPYMIDCCDRMSRGLCGNVGAVKKGPCCRLMYLGLHRWFLAIYPRLAPANESNQSCTNLERKQLVAI